MESTDQKTHYQTLGVEKLASDSEIRKAYYRLAKQIHPDRQDNDKDRAAATPKFQALGNAYQVLSDPNQRRMYDFQLQAASLASRSHQTKNNSNGSSSTQESQNSAPRSPYPEDFGRGHEKPRASGGTSTNYQWYWNSKGWHEGVPPRDRYSSQSQSSTNGHQKAWSAKPGANHQWYWNSTGWHEGVPPRDQYSSQSQSSTDGQPKASSAHPGASYKAYGGYHGPYSKSAPPPPKPQRPSNSRSSTHEQPKPSSSSHRSASSFAGARRSSSSGQRGRSSEEPPRSSSHGQRVVWGLRQDGLPCKRCIKQGCYCYQHQDPANYQRKKQWRGSAPKHPQHGFSSSSPSGRPQQTIYGVRKDGEPCKRCQKQCGFCYQHQDQKTTTTGNKQRTNTSNTHRRRHHDHHRNY